MNPSSTIPANERRRYGTIVTMKDPAVVEILGHAGYDFAIIDMEHTMFDFSLVEHMIRAASCAGVTSIVRTPKNDFGTILRVLDAGSNAIMVPHLTTREQAEKTVNAAKYRPIGTRGLDGSSRAARYGSVPFQEHIRRQNESVYVIGMIEDREALDQLDELIRVEGLDALFVGPADLAASLGYQHDFAHPVVTKAIEEIIRKASEAGLSVGIPAASAEEISAYSAMGADFFTMPAIDVLLFSKALADCLQGIKGSELLKL